MSDIVTLNGYKIKDEKAVRSYDTVALMKADTKLKEGYHVKTKGYYTSGDGGSAEYIITNTESLNDYQEELNNGLYGNLIINDVINIKQFGARENEDNTQIFETINTFNSNKKYKIYVPKGLYYISQIIFDYENICLFGEGKGLSILKSIANNSNTDSLIKFENEANIKNEIYNLKIDGNKNNNNNVFDGIKCTSDSEYFTGIDSYSNIHDLDIELFTGSGLNLETPYLRELRVNNIRSLNNDINGIKFNGITDSIITNCTCSSNKEYGYYIKSFNVRMDNCKAHHNGYGDENPQDIDYTRVPTSDLIPTEDETPQSGKTYYTKSDLDVIEKFTGNSFEIGTTYYEIEKLYYKRYAGFYLEIYRSNINNIESQDNFGDGIYINGGRNNITNVVCDNNGIIIINGTPVSYASQNLSQIYDGIHMYKTSDNNIIGSFTNSRYSNIGYCQRSGLYIDDTGYYDGKTNATLICDTQIENVITKNLGSNSVIKIDVNGEQFYDNCLLSNVEMYKGSIYSSGDIQSSIKKYGNKVDVQLVLTYSDGYIQDSTTNDMFIGKIPVRFRPKQNINVIGILSDNKGLTQYKYCTVTLTPDGNIRLRNTGSTQYNDLIIKTSY